MIRFLIISSFILIISMHTNAQVSINDTGINANAHSMLDVDASTNNKGVLLPRLTTTERITFGTTIANTEESMLVYDTDLSSYWYWDGTNWKQILADDDYDWERIGTEIFSAHGGNYPTKVAIGNITAFSGSLPYTLNIGGTAGIAENYFYLINNVGFAVGRPSVEYAGGAIAYNYSDGLREVNLFNVDTNTSIPINNGFTFSQMKTNSTHTDLLRIQGDGKVGIGTSNPSCKLQVTGENNTFLNVGTDDTYQGTISLFGNPSGYPGGEIDFYTGNDYDTDINFYFIDAYQDWLRIGRHSYTYDFGLYKNGHIRIGQPRGIGSLVSGTDPVKMLQVNDVANGGIGLDYKNGIWFKNEANTDWIRALTVHGISSDDNIYIGSGSNPVGTNIHFDVGGTGLSAIFIDGGTGFVGMGGIDDPTELLEVNGTIKIRDNIDGHLKLGYCGGIEGGQIDFAGAPTYSNWVTDIVQNNYRIFALNASGYEVQIFNEVAGADVDLYIDGKIGIGIHNTSYKLQLPNNTTTSIGSGGAYAWLTYSDSRLKTEQQTLDYGLQTIMQIRPKRYNHHNSTFEKDRLVISNTETDNTFGFIAQELYQIIPEAVFKPSDENTNLWSVEYSKVVPVLVKAIQEQQAIIEQQQQIIETQNNRLNNVEELILELSKELEKLKE